MKTPIIYVVIPKDNNIKKLKIETLDSNGKVIEKIPMIKKIKPGEIGNIEIESKYFNYIEDGEYRVKITPISEGKNKYKNDREGESKTLKFVVDTKINALSSGSIGEIDTEGKIKVSINELSGISKYEYEFILDYGEKITGIDSVNFQSDITGKLNTFKVDISRVAGRLTEIGGALYLTVWDKLGHRKKLPPKSYIGKIKLIGTITTSVKEEMKQRRSKIKIINGKYSIGNNIVGSSED